MELIYHTADITKDKESLETVLNSGLSTVELDFVMSLDGELVWAHDMLPTSLTLPVLTGKKDKLTLFDILEINNHRHKLMLDLKYIPKSILFSSYFTKLLNDLNNYDELQIQSLDLDFLKRLKAGNFSNIEVGLIINVLTKWYISKYHKLPVLDFMSISSELWEKNKGAYIDKCNTLYPSVKKYAWTWATRVEDEYKIDTFINKGANGIITGTPDYVKKLANRDIYSRKISLN